MARFAPLALAPLLASVAAVLGQDTPASPSGEVLARQHCATCHLFPEPASLPRDAWLNVIRPAMARWLGRAPVDYERLQDGRRLREAALFPSAPMVTDAEWERLWEYYANAAPEKIPIPSPTNTAGRLTQFRARKLNPTAGAPMTSLVKIDPAQKRLLIGDAFAGMLYTLKSSGEVERKWRADSAPVAWSAGKAQVFLTLIGNVFPSDAAEGSVWRLGGLGTQARPVLQGLRRPTHTAVADLNQDGREDLVVSSFGNLLGNASWFENRGDGRYEEHLLLDRAGVLRSEVVDANGDGRPDVFVMAAQGREGLWLLVNEGAGKFRIQTLQEWPPTWGGADFTLADFNRDGRVDVLTVHGDNGDFALGPKPYHGLRVYLNQGDGRFSEAWFYPLPGAYRAVVRDFDGDGDPDVAAVAFYPDFGRTPVESFVYLENLGGLKFTPRHLAEADCGRWITLDAGDLDGDGDEDLALGSFVTGPETTPVPASVKERWRTNGAAVLLLENLRR